MGRRIMWFFGLALAQIAAGCTDGGDSPLAAAAAADNVPELQRLLAGGAGPDRFDSAGVTPLIAASRAGAVNAIRALIAAGADPNLRDARSTGWPPIMHAIHRQQAAALAALLAAGADPNVRTAGGGAAALLMAAAEDDPVFLATLLEHGADPRADGKDGARVMTIAVSGGALRDIDRSLLGGCHPQTVRALLDYDPSLRLAQEYGPTRGARLFARFHGCREVLEIIERVEAEAARKAERQNLPTAAR